MGYDVKYRTRVVEYRSEGHTIKETSETFKVAESTVKIWSKKYKEEGHLENKELKRTFKKVDPEKLTKYVAENPDAYLEEIAEKFQCSDTAICNALKKLNITRKKRQRGIGSRMHKK